MVPRSSRVANPANVSIVHHLEEERDNCDNPNRSATLKRAIKSVRSCPTPITCRADAIKLHNIGPRIAQIIDLHLRHRRGPAAAAAGEAAIARLIASSAQSGRAVNNQEYSVRTLQRETASPNQRIASAVAVSDDDGLIPMASGTGRGRGRGRGRGNGRGRGRGRRSRAEGVMSALSVQERNESDGEFQLDNDIPESVYSGAVVIEENEANAGGNATGRRGSTRQRRTRRASGARGPYIPGYRTGGFAILLVLLGAHEQGEDKLHKSDIIERAQPYADENISSAKTADPTTWFNGWNNMKTLNQHGYVKRWSNPPWFALTSIGKEVAQRCRSMEQELQERTLQEYGAGSALGSAFPQDSDNEEDQSFSPSTFSPAGRSSRRRQRRTPQSHNPPIPDRPTETSLHGGTIPTLSQENANPWSEHIIAHQEHRPPASSARGSLNILDPPMRRDASPELNFALQQSVNDGESNHTENLDEPRGLFALVHKEEFGAMVDIANPNRGESQNDSDREEQPNSGNNSNSARDERRNILERNVRSIVFPRAEPLATPENGNDIIVISDDENVPSLPVYNRRKRGKEAEMLQSEGHLQQSSNLRVSPGHYSSAEARRNELSDNFEEMLSPSNDLDAGTNNEMVNWLSNRPNYRDLDRRPMQIEHVEPRQKRAKKSHEGREPVPEWSNGSSLLNAAYRAPLVEGGMLHRRIENIQNDSFRHGNSEIDNDVEILEDINVTRGSKDEGPKKSHHIEKLSLTKHSENIIGIGAEIDQYTKHRTFTDEPEVVDLVDDEDPVGYAQDDALPSIEANESKCNIVLVLDSMERSRTSIISTGEANAMAGKLKEQDVDCIIRSLPVGDALFIARYSDGSEVVLDYLVERKTIGDFAASMIDGRVKRQSYLMTQSQVANKMFVLEGDISRNVHFRENPHYQDKLLSLEICEGFTVHRTKDLRDTLQLYRIIFNRLCNDFCMQPLSAVLEKRPLFPDWKNRMKSLKNGLTLEQLFSIQLCHLRGISVETAHALISAGYTTPQSVYQALLREPDPGKRKTVLNVDGVTKRQSKMLCAFFTSYDYGTEMLTD